MTFSSSYARISDESTSMSGPYATADEAVKIAESNLLSDDISETWVRDMSLPNTPVIWHSHNGWR